MKSRNKRGYPLCVAGKVCGLENGRTFYLEILRESGAEGNNGTPGVASAAPHFECGGPQEASLRQPMCRLDAETGRVPYFRIYDLRSTYATRLRAGGVADELVTQLHRQGDAKVFKKYSRMKLQMKREALAKLNRHANEGGLSFGTV